MNNFNDPFGVWNGEKFEFTLKKLCDIIFNGRPYTMPAAFQNIQDKPLSYVSADKMPELKGLRVVFDLSWNVDPAESEKRIKNYLSQGIIIVTKRRFLKNKTEKYPVIRIRDVWEAWINLGKYVKNVFPMPTIGLTGSAGKTTSTMFAECVFNERYNTFVSGLNGLNYNTTLSIVGQWILRANPSYNFHVQECGGETIDLIKASAQVLDVDGFGITNIDTTQHIATYKTPENLIADKTSFDRVRNENTFAVINYDDKILRKFRFESPVISFAINDESADYVGKNIVQNNELLEFDVVSKEETVHIRIHIIGEHNVYNALMVFAFAKKYGLTNEEIQRGFFKYESIGIRQCLKNFGGRLIYMDAYNASVESTSLSITALENIAVNEGSRRIAVIGERKTSSEETFNINFELGRKLADFDKVDEFIIVGLKGTYEKPEYEHALYDGALSVFGDSDKISYYTDISQVANRLRYQTKPGDIILLKGRHQLSLWSISDIAFGTSYFNPPLGSSVPVASNMWNGRYYDSIAGVNLLSTTIHTATKLIIPNIIQNKPVVRIGNKLFSHNHSLYMIVFGINVRTIGNEAFMDCSNLQQLELPKACLFIANNAFENCTSLCRASLPGVTHISKGAFKNCVNLRYVFVTEKCAMIEDGAFENCPDLRIYAPAESFAEEYAKENNISFETVSSDDELGFLAKNGTRLYPNMYSLDKNEDFAVENESDEESDTVSLSVVAAGDIQVNDVHLTSYYDSEYGTYNFDKFFINTKKHFKSADLAIGNVEGVFGPGVYSGTTKYNTPDELGEALQHAGINVVVSANNHIYDSKYIGIVRTKRIFNGFGIDVAGIRSSEEDKSYTIKDCKGVKIAVINYTYRTPSVTGAKTINHLRLDDKAEKLINSFCFETLDDDLRRISKEISSARKDGADIVIVYYHWGTEFSSKVSTLQKYIAFSTAKMGADAILGSHSHLLQEIDNMTVDIDGVRKNVPVFYGLGNYSWGLSLPRNDEELFLNGALAKLNIEYDKANKKLVSIKTDHIPLYIKTDYIYNKFDFSILSLKDLNEFEAADFNENSLKSASELMEEIDAQLNKNSENSIEKCFESIIEIPVGGQINLSDTFLAEEYISEIRSENAPVASVTQNLTIIGNSFGFAGITAMRDDGSEICFVVKVKGKNANKIPVLVDKYNFVPENYKPFDLVSGEAFGLSASVYLTRPTALAWNVMKKSAAKSNININCISGYRNNQSQRNKIILNKEKETDVELMEPGFSEHHLGNALNVAPMKNNSPEAAFDWLKDNAHEFGFMIGNSESDDHMHLWYPDVKFSLLEINENGVTRSEFIENFHSYDTSADFE